MEIICGNPECTVVFTPKCHNGKYCSKECRTLVMNKRILERYYEKKAIKNSTTKRVCSVNDCETILSKYNSESICELHRLEKFKKKLKKWGWDFDEAIAQLDE